MMSDETCLNEKKVASFPSYSEDVSIFVNYPQAIKELHREASMFIKGMMGGASATTEIMPKIVEKYNIWDRLTKETLQSTIGLIQYEVKIGVNDHVDESSSSSSGPSSGVDPMMFHIGPLDNED